MLLEMQIDRNFNYMIIMLSMLIVDEMIVFNVGFKVV